MNGKKTLIIALIFGLVAGGYYLDQQRIGRKEEAKKTESRLLAQHGNSLTGLEMHREGAPEVKLAKEDKHWKLSEPVKARADRETIETLLNQIELARKENVFTPDSDKLADYGLAKPQMTVDFSDGSATKIPSLEVGAKTSDGASLYARLGDQKEVFTLGQDFVKQLGSTALQLRDKRTVPANVGEATTVTLAYADKVFTLEHHNDGWEITHPVRQKADDNAVSGLLTTWGNMKASTFIDTPTLNLAKFGLEQPYLTATAYVDGDEGKKNYTMLVGDALSTATATVGRNAKYQGDPTIYAIPDDEVSKMRVTLDNLRSKDLITIQSTDAGRVDWRMLKHTMELKRGADLKWTLADDPQTKLDQSVVLQKLNALAALKATKFFANDLSTSTTGLNESNVSVTAWSKDGKTSETLETGRKADDGDWVYCRISSSNGRNEIVGVDWTKPGDLFITRDDLLDKSIYSYETDQAQKATLADATASLTLTRTASGAWNGTKVFDGKPGANFSVEPVAMNNLLQSIRGLEWKRKLSGAVVADEKEIDDSGMRAPKRRIRLYDGAGKTIIDLVQGTSGENTAYFGDGTAYYTIDKFRIAGYLDALKAVFASAGSNLQLLDSGKVMLGSPESQQIMSQGHPVATPAPFTMPEMETTGTMPVKEDLISKTAIAGTTATKTAPAARSGSAATSATK